MTTLQLYLNDELVDLSDDSPMALTYQINNLAEVKNQQGNTSNQFKLPLTQRNRRILGFPDEVAFTNEMPYRQYAAKIVQDGLEIIPYGTGELNGVEQDTASITILSGNVDFFDAIEGKLYDMGDITAPVGAQQLFKPYEHTWNVQNVTQSQTNTGGWIWPVIDYGKMPADLTGTPSIDVRYLRPGFFLHTAVELMVKSAGYSIHPDSFLVNDELYKKLIVQFANDSFEHGTDYQNLPNSPYGIAVSVGAQLYVTHIPVTDNGGLVSFSSIDSDPSQQFSGGTTFVSKQIITSDIVLNIPTVRFEGRVTGSHPSTLKLYLLLNGAIQQQADFDLTGDFVRVSGSGGSIQGYKDYKDIVLNTTAELKVGDQVKIAYEFLGDRPAYFTIYPGAKLTIQPKDKTVLYGQQVQCERILPDIGLKDLLKDTFQRFGIICQTEATRRIIRFASFRDIVANIPRAADWTTKCLDQGKSISFQLGGYAQVNYMKYKADDGVLPATLGQSQVNVDDKTLPAIADLFESQFAATIDQPFIDGTTAQILKVDPKSGSNDFSLSTQPRLLIDDKFNLMDRKREVRFTDGNPANDVIVNDWVCTPYFNKSAAPYNLTFDYLRQTYYPELEKILHRSKKVVRYFILTPRDILELDLLIPVYLQQDGAYYYINKVDAWRKGQPVKVELIKLD